MPVMRIGERPLSGQALSRGFPLHRQVTAGSVVIHLKTRIGAPMARKKADSPSKEIVAVASTRDIGGAAQAILDFVSKIPSSKEPTSKRPGDEARRIANSAASKAGLTAGSLALPPGPLGWLTVLPELVMIWKIQAQMVSDIASTFGKEATLGREQMLYCLFRHTAAQAFRDVVIRMGDRLVFRRAGMAALERVAKNIGINVSRRAVGKGISRWLPVGGWVRWAWAPMPITTPPRWPRRPSSSSAATSTWRPWT